MVRPLPLTATETAMERLRSPQAEELPLTPIRGRPEGQQQLALRVCVRLVIPVPFGMQTTAQPPIPRQFWNLRSWPLP